MKLIMIAIFFLETFLLPMQVIAKKKKNPTIKFHKPETEAEKALDVILRVESGLIKNSTLKHEDMFTEGFDRDYERQNKMANEREICKQFGGMDCEAFGCTIPNCEQDTPPHGYEFFTIYQKYNYAYITKIWASNLHNQEIITTKTKLHDFYIIKKENGRWKIDGLCCGDGINYNHCHLDSMEKLTLFLE